MKTKLHPEVFRSGAESLARMRPNSVGACWAVGEGLRKASILVAPSELDAGYYSLHHGFLGAVLLPQAADPDVHWFDTPVKGVADTPELVREARLLGLLLCAELLEDGFTIEDFA